MIIQQHIKHYHDDHHQQHHKKPSEPRLSIKHSQSFVSLSFLACCDGGGAIISGKHIREKENEWPQFVISMWLQHQCHKEEGNPNLTNK